MKEVNSYIGNHLKEARKKRKLTQDFVADYVGISRQLLQQHEQGIAKIHVSRLFKFCEALGIDIKTLMEELAHFTAKNDEAQHQSSRGMEIIKRRPLKVFLIEDTAADELSIVQAIEASDVEVKVTVARDGAQALQMLAKSCIDQKNGRPDLILLDLNIPMINGRDLLKQLRNHSAYCGIPVVVLTNSIDIRDMESSYMLGASGYLVKSFNLDEFYSHIQLVMSYWHTNVLPN